MAFELLACKMKHRFVRTASHVFTAKYTYMYVDQKFLHVCGGYAAYHATRSYLTFETFFTDIILQSSCC